MSDAPVLLICRTGPIADGLRRRLDRSRFVCIGPGDSTMGMRFSAALVTVPDFRGSEAERTRFEDWINCSVRTRLDVGCTDKLFYL